MLQLYYIATANRTLVQKWLENNVIFIYDDILVGEDLRDLTPLFFSAR